MDYFPRKLSGEHGIYAQYRGTDGLYVDLAYEQDYMFITPNVPFLVPRVGVTDFAAGLVHAHPSAVIQVGYKRDAIVRVTLHGASGAVRVTGEGIRLAGASSMRFYIYKGAGAYSAPLWQAWDGGAFDLVVPYADGEELFFATDAGPNDINDWSYWRGIVLEGADTPPNQPPVATDQSVATDEDTAKAITLTASDPDNDPLTYSLVSVPAHGSLSGTMPDLTYTPDANYTGPDSFTFKANDGQADSNVAT